MASCKEAGREVAHCAVVRGQAFAEPESKTGIVMSEVREESPLG